MFSRDEMQRAIEDALKSMEGIALELYRRGREPLLEELEDCRARNADLCTMLERVATERDEALARCETLRELADAAAYEQGLAQRRMMDAQRERDEARAELSKLREDYDSVLEANVGLLDGAPYVDARKAFRRGAEAMRKHCAMWIKHNSHEDGLGMGSQRIESALAALPIPEEP